MRFRFAVHGLALPLNMVSPASTRPERSTAIIAGKQVILANLGEDDFPISKGDRIAQIVVAPVTHAAMVEVEELTIPLAVPEVSGSTGV